MQRLAYSSHSPDQLRSAGGELPGQIVLVLQGGGALGSYQAGVYQALHEAGIAPDWIIGTSIGAINAGLIAGNEPQCRLERLHEFWRRVQRVPHWSFRGPFPGFGERWLTYWTTLTQGIPGFSRQIRLPTPGMPFRWAPTAPATTRRRRSNRRLPNS